MKKTALIVGASRGLGLGLVRELSSRGWQVIATERKKDPQSGLRKYEASGGGGLRIEQVDINELPQIEKLGQALKGQSLDLLFVNAGVSSGTDENAGQVTTNEFNRVMETNALGPLRVVERLSGLVRAQGTIVVMSSILGSVSENTSGGYEVYRASKAALNTLMRSYAARSGGDRTLLAMHPGWVRTDMGGSAAPLDVETSARGMVDAIIKREGQKGLKYIDYQNKEIGW